MINFVVSSLEDTILTDGQKSVPEDIIEYILKLKKKNILFAVATSRNYDAVYPMFGSIKDEIIYICNDGGVIIYKDQTLCVNKIDRMLCMDVIKTTEGVPRFKLIFAGERNVVINQRDMELEHMLSDANVHPVYEKDLNSVRNSLNKITIYVPDGLDEQTYKNFYIKWSSKANVSVSDAEHAFITATNVNKGNAIAYIQELYGLSEEDTVVFGCGYSDIDMFSHAYFSYAMQYADMEVKREAKHIAENLATILDDVLMIS